MKDPVYALAEAEVDMLSRISKHSDHGQDIRLDGEPQHNLVITVTIMTGTSTEASSPTTTNISANNATHRYLNCTFQPVCNLI